MEKRLKEIVAEQLGIEEDAIATGSDFQSDLGADSLDFVELVMAVEEEWDIEITDEAAEKLTTFDAMLTYLQENA